MPTLAEVREDLVDVVLLDTVCVDEDDRVSILFGEGITVVVEPVVTVLLFDAVFDREDEVSHVFSMGFDWLIPIAPPAITPALTASLVLMSAEADGCGGDGIVGAAG